VDRYYRHLAARFPGKQFELTADLRHPFGKLAYLLKIPHSLGKSALVEKLFAIVGIAADSASG